MPDLTWHPCHMHYQARTRDMDCGFPDQVRDRLCPQ